MYRSILRLNPANDPRRDRPQRDWISNPYRVHQRIMWAFDGAFPPPDKYGNRPSRLHLPTLPLFRIFPESGHVLVQSAGRPDWKRAFAEDRREAHFLLAPGDVEVTEYSPCLVAGTAYLFQVLVNPVPKVSRLQRILDGTILCPTDEGYIRKKAGEKEQEYKQRLKTLGLKKRHIHMKMLTSEDTKELNAIIDRKERHHAFQKRYKQRHLEWMETRLLKTGFDPWPIESGKSQDCTDQESVAKCGIRIRQISTVRAFKGHKADESKGHNITLHAAVFEGVLRVSDPVLALQTLASGIGPGKGLGFGLLLLGAPLNPSITPA